MKKLANVRFESNPFKTYQFLTDIEDLKESDQLVVDTRNGLTVAQFESYSDTKKPGLTNLKWIVEKIDLERHEKRMENERRLNAIKRKMESRRKELEEIQLFALLAKEDESMKSLYEEFMELSK